MVEWMLFVFIVIHTEASKINIMIEHQEHDRIQLELFMQDMQLNPDKVHELDKLIKQNEK
jgi:oligoribonuclease NrnB/cAMP/cGMP phosphodiesterase (DHH superfamily)